jgi:two-component system cell cycle response regulator
MGARVLVIEDNGPNLELMTYLLTAFGHSTDSARDGEEGIAKALREEFDLVICDIQLPKRDGFEVAQAIRGGGRAVPLVAVTAFAQVGDRERVMAAGFDGYISKPIAPETFVGQVEAFLAPADRSSATRAAEAAMQLADASPAPSRSAIVLVVDDVEANLLLMRSLLEPFGYGVGIAHSVDEALRYVADTIPNLIVSDLHLRDGSGLDLIAAVKKDARLTAVPFIFLSSTARGADEKARAAALGARKFIVRPIDAPVLLAEIEECLRKD